jgi:hypothetical protein
MRQTYVQFDETHVWESWGMRILGVDVDDTFGMQQLIMQDIQIEYAKLFPPDKPWLHKYNLPRYINFR